MPLISKRWARILRGPSAAWRELDVAAETDFAAVIGAECSLPDAEARADSIAAVVAWFCARAGGVERLQLATSNNAHVPCSLVCAAFTTQLASLRKLSFAAYQCGLGSTDMFLLGSCYRLQHLKIELPRADYWIDHSRALFGTLFRLPELRHLELVPACSTAWTLPTVAELATLNHNKLQHLELPFVGDASDNLALGRLPALKCCRLAWQDTCNLRIRASCFVRTPRLEELLIKAAAPSRYCCTLV